MVEKVLQLAHVEVDGGGHVPGLPDLRRADRVRQLGHELRLLARVERRIRVELALDEGDVAVDSGPGVGPEGGLDPTGQAPGDAGGGR